MAEFASHGVGTAALTTGIIGTAGTALGLLTTHGGIGGLLGNNTDMASLANTALNLSDKYVTKTEFDLTQQIARKDSEIALLKSEQNTEIKIADVYERVMTRVNADQREQASWNASQSVANAQMSSAIATNNASIQSLANTVGNITKCVVPITAVCPEPMKLYNSWTAPNATQTAGG